jgi:hypothetical protein
MTPALLRQVWSLVETAQANVLLTLDDTSLVQWLIRQIRKEQSLDSDEASILNSYIYSKLSLIRDLAHEKVGV